MALKLLALTISLDVFWKNNLLTGVQDSYVGDIGGKLQKFTNSTKDIATWKNLRVQTSEISQLDSIRKLSKESWARVLHNEQHFLFSPM